MLKRYVIILLTVVTLLSCNKDERIVKPEPTPTPQIETQKITVQFSPNYKQLPLIYNQFIYKNTANDSFMVSKWKFYVSNIALKGATTSYRLRESYYLIDFHDTEHSAFTLTGIPAGNYTSIEFLVGIDSTRNVSGAQVGVLSQDAGMFWSWNQGYIFSKLEGEFTNSIVTAPQIFSHHIGGFSGTNNCIVKTIVPFTTTPLIITDNSQNKLSLAADLDTYLNGLVTIDMTTFSAVSGGRNAKIIATNYKNMFTVKEVKN
jgi:hypothetical protein